MHSHESLAGHPTGWGCVILRYRVDRLGCLVDMGKRGRKLADKEKLFERWVTTYPELLRPKLVLGRYRAVDRDWWKHAPLHNFRGYWGGEVAAAKQT